MLNFLKKSTIGACIILVFNHDVYSISIFQSGKVRNKDMFPILNPHYDSSHSFIEDDYVLVKILGDNYDPKSIKNHMVRILNNNTKVLRKVLCLEGEWCPTHNGFTFVQSGHAWVSSETSENYAVTQT
jgi:hypothetical protein